ncbi:MAG: AAA family ATPase [Alteromonadaceae bacterium]|nr:MAG: AAA family ATPase [Alteromonadaceae bacterium]
MKYPIGMQTFPEIINEGYVYIDKTALIHRLITQGKWYFLARPRRFGKSLLVSTLESLFKGQKACFEGLDILNTDYTFTAHPVIKLELTQADIVDADSFQRFISEQAQDLAEEHQITLTSTRFERQFKELITRLHKKTGKTVVLLIDEYDKPILNTLESDKLSKVKSALNAFYAMVKSLDQYLRFVFITGVSKFSKVSVFSGMNNLDDISLDSDYATLCGYTKKELTHYFDASINQLAHTLDIPQEDAYKQIEQWYNGYVFSENCEGVFNPFSILSLLKKRQFQNYWFLSATPTFLIERLKAKQYDLSQLDNLQIAPEGLSASEPENTSIQALLLQTGYLTIKSRSESLYQLDFPNKEVRDSFFKSIVEQYAYIEKGIGPIHIEALKNGFKHQDLALVFSTLTQFFANLPYDIAIQEERYYQSIFFAVFKLLGFLIEVEVSTNKGRIDCVVWTDNRIYIIEFKLNGTKEDALQQIKDKQYAQKYTGLGKHLSLLGVAFDQKERNIQDWIEEAFIE